MAVVCSILLLLFAIRTEMDNLYIQSVILNRVRMHHSEPFCCTPKARDFHFTRSVVFFCLHLSFDSFSTVHFCIVTGKMIVDKCISSVCFISVLFADRAHYRVQSTGTNDRMAISIRCKHLINPMLLCVVPCNEMGVLCLGTACIIHLLYLSFWPTECHK